MDAQPPADIQVLSTKVLEEINAEISWRIRAVEAEAKVKDLQSQLDAIKNKDTPK